MGTARAARTQPGADIPGEECHAPRIGTKRCRPRAGAGVPIAGPVCPALMEFREAKRRVLPDTRWLGVESDGCARLDVEGYSWKGGRLSFSGKIQFAECYIGLNTTTSLGVDDEIAGNRVTAGQQRPAWGGAARRRQRYSPHRCGDFLSHPPSLGLTGDHELAFLLMVSVDALVGGFQRALSLASSMGQEPR